MNGLPYLKGEFLTLAKTATITNDRISKLEDSNGVIRARLEEDVVRQRLSRDIYSNPSSGFRELYVNEARACKRALALKSDNQPRIMLTMDHSNRNLVIHGINSLGMPLKRFKEVLAVLGETDNDSGNEIGQFGMGHLAFRALSDNILFESFSLESSEKYSYLGDGEKYERLPEPRGLESTGTRVTVTLREDINLRKLEEYARTVCAFSNIDTFLTVLNEDGNEIRESDQVNIYKDLGNVVSSSYGIPIEIDDDDFYLKGMLVPRSSDSRPAPTVLLLRVPIQAKNLASSLELFHTCVLNVKNERKYKPAADRERLREDAQELLLQEINSKLKETVPRALDLKSLDDFRNSPCHDFYYASGETELYTPSKETQEITNIVNFHVKRNGDGKDSIKLGNFLVQSKHLFLSRSVVREYEHVLRKEYEDAIVFKAAYRYNYDAYSEKLFQKYGIRTDTEEEFQRVKAKLGREWRAGLDSEARTESDDAPYYVTIHQSHIVTEERYGRTTHYLSERAESEYRASWIDEKVIFIPSGKLSKYLEILTEVDSSYKLTKANPKRIPNAVTLDEFVRKVNAKEVETSDGRMTFSQIIDTKKRVEILVYGAPMISKAYKVAEKRRKIFLALDSGEAFELAVLCIYSGVSYDLRSVVAEDTFHSMTGRSRTGYFGKYRDCNGSSAESYEPEDTCVANCAFHVASAVADKGLVEMYLCAMEGEKDASKAREYRDYLFSLQSASSKVQS